MKEAFKTLQIISKSTNTVKSHGARNPAIMDTYLYHGDKHMFKLDVF